MKYTLLFLVLISFYIPKSFAQDSTSRGKISGYAFGDFYYNAERDTFKNLSNVAFGGPKGQNGFQFKRIYFTYDYQISKKFSSRFRLEGAQDNPESKVGVYVRDAYLEWKDAAAMMTVTFGIQPVIAYTTTDAVWGHRYVERTIMDLRGIVDSRDFGLSLMGNFDKAGKYSYGLLVGNNSGVNVESNKYKRVYLHFGFNPMQNVFLTLFTDFRAQPDKYYRTVNTAYTNDHFTYAVMAGYKNDKRLSFGAESFYNIRKNDVLNGTQAEDKNTWGVSAFFSVPFHEKFSAFGRYDFFDDNIKDYAKEDARNLFIFGLEYRADKNVYVSPNVTIETYEAFQNGTTIKPSITPKLTLFYSFN
jgi:hypothetical protein